MSSEISTNKPQGTPSTYRAMPLEINPKTMDKTMPI